jgi:hypothetical protein
MTTGEYLRIVVEIISNNIHVMWNENEQTEMYIASFQNDLLLLKFWYI